MKTVLIAKYELGCFTIGPPGLSSVDKRFTQHKSSLETQAASRTNSATNMTVVAVTVAAGFILVAVAISIISVLIALARKRGLAQERGVKAFCADLLQNRRHSYGSLVPASDDGKVRF